MTILRQNSGNESLKTEAEIFLMMGRSEQFAWQKVQHFSFDLIASELEAHQIELKRLKATQ